MVNKKNNEDINVSLGTLLGVPILMNTSSILANDPIDIEWIVENPEAFNLSNIQCTANGVLQPKGHIDGFFTVYPSTTTKYSVHCTDE